MVQIIDKRLPPFDHLVDYNIIKKDAVERVSRSKTTTDACMHARVVDQVQYGEIMHGSSSIYCRSHVVDSLSSEG